MAKVVPPFLFEHDEASLSTMTRMQLNQWGLVRRLMPWTDPTSKLKPNRLAKLCLGVSGSFDP